MKKIILTSAIAIIATIPSYATSYSAGDTATCNSGVLGIDTGTASATAGWEAKSYQCSAGQYLPDGDTWTSAEVSADDGRRQCPANSYCGGGTYQYSEANDQGIAACSSVGNGTYTLSEAGASSANDCYRNCAAGDVDHLKSGGTVTGKYYSNATNMCEPANAQQCAAGYHYVAGVNPTTIANTIGTDAGSGYTSNDYTGEDYDTDGMSNDIIANDPMAFAVDYGSNKGMIKGHGRCSKRSATDPWVGENYAYVLQSDGTVATLTDETDPDTGGQYCYCHLESYTLNGTTQSLSAPWVFYDDDGVAGDCAANCAFNCAGRLQRDAANSLAFRSAVFGAVGATPAQCSANVITINWGDGAGGTHETNTCTYDDTLTAPATAPTKKGHTFAGWTFGQQ